MLQILSPRLDREVRNLYRVPDFFIVYCDNSVILQVISCARKQQGIHTEGDKIMMNGAMGKIRRMALVIGFSMMSILPAGSAFRRGDNILLTLR